MKFLLHQLQVKRCMPTYPFWSIPASIMQANTLMETTGLLSELLSISRRGTNNRQLHLAETKYFVCSCPRCADPTELGTMFSSIRCPQCTAENGYLVPTVPGHCELVDTAMADWRCVTCAKTQTAKFVNAVTQSIGEELVSLEKGSIEACQSFIRKHSQNLHPNHYYLMDIKLALCQMIGQSAAGH